MQRETLWLKQGPPRWAMQWRLLSETKMALQWVVYWEIEWSMRGRLNGRCSDETIGILDERRDSEGFPLHVVS